MADLDDFFAKKDKKKKGAKKGFSKANTDVLKQNLEENDRKEQQAEEKANDASRSMRIIGSQSGGIANDNDGDDWLVYEDRKVDYTSLKIDTLRVDDESDQNEEGTETNEDGEKVKKSKEGGPWSKLVASDSIEKPSDLEEKVPEPVKEEKPEPVAPVKSSSYVPPHLRNASASSTPSPSANSVTATRGGPKRTKHAPDINSEVYFPSLSAAMGTDDPNHGQGSPQSGRGFEEVKSVKSSGPSYSKASDAPKLSLDNKFAALRE